MCQGLEPWLNCSCTSHCLPQMGIYLPSYLTLWCFGPHLTSQRAWMWVWEFQGDTYKSRHTRLREGHGGGHTLSRLTAPQPTQQETRRASFSLARYLSTAQCGIFNHLRITCSLLVKVPILLEKETDFPWTCSADKKGSLAASNSVAGICEDLHTFNKYPHARGSVTLSSKEKTL